MTRTTDDKGDKLPYRRHLERTFQADLSTVENVTPNARLAEVGARAASGPEMVSFAETLPPIGLVAHEIAHVLQHRTGSPQVSSSRAESEANQARAHVESGRGGAFAVRGGPGARIQYDTGGDNAPLESPFAAAIEEDFVKDAPPGTVTQKLTVRAPGDAPTTVVLDSAVTGASMVTAYAVPLDRLYATAELAAAARKAKEKDRSGFSIVGGPISVPSSGTPTTKAAKTTPAKTAPAPKVTASADAPAATSTSGKVANAGPSTAPNPNAQTVFDIFGKEIPLVERAGGWGITTEFTKISVGAASTGVLISADGSVTLVDAGVRLAGSVPDAAVADYAMKRLRELAVTKTGGRAPIKNVLITHAHLDHTGLLETIAKEFVIEKITINAAQVNDAGFHEVAKRVAKNQLELHRKQIAEEIRQTKSEWLKSDAAKAKFEEGARDAAFEEHVKTQTEVELAKRSPKIQLEVHVPGPGGAEIPIKLGEFDLVRKPATQRAEGEAFSAKDLFGVTVLDETFERSAREQGEAIEKNPKAELTQGDKLSSHHILELGNGEKLIVVPDARNMDIVKVGTKLVEAINSLGGEGIRLVDISHHFQSGVMGDAAAANPPKVDGIIKGSELARFTEVLTKIAGNKGAFTVTSGDPMLMDPAVVYLLESCGIRVIPAVGATDVQYIAGITAKGESIGGFRSGDPITAERAALLHQTDTVLEHLAAERKAAEKRVVEEKAEQKAAAEERAQELAFERESLHDKVATAKAYHQMAADAVENPPKGSTMKKKARISARARAGEKVADAEAELREAERAAKAEVAAIENAEGMRQKALNDLTKQINDIKTAKEALLSRVKASSQPSVKGADNRGKTLPSFETEETALRELVEPVYDAGVRYGDIAKIPRITETSLVLLGKSIERTNANTALLDAWRNAWEARTKAAKPGATIGDHLELLDQLKKLRAEIAKRPDIADQKAVEHELQFIDDQIKQSTDIVREASEREAVSTTTERDPLTGNKTKTTLVEKEAPAERPAEEAKAGEPAKSDPAKSGEPAPGEPPKPSRFETGVKIGADVVGRGLGALMVVQNVTAGAELYKAYEEGRANLPETAIGITKSAYGISIGARMLAGVHVGVGEFILVSALDIAQVLAGDYTSSAEFNTELTYAIIRAGVNTALMLVGMWLMSTGPWGVIAGLIIMALGDPILEFLGIKSWLAKKFDPRPDQMIDLDEDLQREMTKYVKLIGDLELSKETDARLERFGATDPKAVRAAAKSRYDDLRIELIMHEKWLLWYFADAYRRARTGYMGLKWLDDQRARFAQMFLEAHKDDDIPEGVDNPVGLLEGFNKKGVIAELQRMEEIVSLKEITVDEVNGMEQWSKLDKRIEELEDLLYHTSYDPSNYDNIDWMDVYEASSLLEQMISNAHYRLEPDKQSTERRTSMIPEGAARERYKELLLQYENKADVLRKRQLDMSLGTGQASGVKRAGRGYEVGVAKAYGMITGLAITYDPDEYYEPAYGPLGVTPDEKTLLDNADIIVNYYVNVIFEFGELPEGVTVETLHSNVDVIKKYSNAYRHDADFQDRMMKLQGARAATYGALGRAHRLLDARPEPAKKLKELDKELEGYEHDRKIEWGIYLPEEIPDLETRVGAAHTATAAALLGEKESDPQLTGFEHAALSDSALKKFHLSTIRDRIIEANIVLPKDYDTPIERMYRIWDAHEVLVGLKPDAEAILARSELDGKVVYVYLDAVPLNDAAIHWYGKRTRLKVEMRDLEPITINQLLNRPPPPIVLDPIVTPAPDGTYTL